MTRTSPPREPYKCLIEPRKTIRVAPIISEGTISSYTSLDIPEGAASIFVEANRGYDGDEIEYKFRRKEEEIPNPGYETEWATYATQLELYNKEREKYAIDKAEWDKIESARKELAERVEYQRLKRKFEAN